MRFLFSSFCALLEQCEQLELREPPILLAADKTARLKHVTESWFSLNRRTIDEAGVDASVILLSALLPERRTDRVYNIQAPRLSRTLSRALCLTAARSRELQQYGTPGRGDLGVCLERVLRAGGTTAHPAVTLDEVDGLLHILADSSRTRTFAGRRVAPLKGDQKYQAVGHILLRLQPHEAKWLVRLILKDYSPVHLDDRLVLSSFHFLLPDLLCFQDNFLAAFTLLRGPLREYPSQPDKRSANLHRRNAVAALKPVVGVKVGRPDYVKARSIDHCMEMIGQRDCVVERKYDGEYCEIHIDLDLDTDFEKCIRIFSKSGKDSTEDRKGLHSTLVKCLKLGEPDCAIKQRAILLGEMVVVADSSCTVMPFEEIRKHVLRSGRSLGTDADAPPREDEHLAIVFFDLLLLDNDVVMNQSVEQRRSRLRQIYRKTPGRAMSVEWTLLSFEDRIPAKRKLIAHFAASLAQRCEGLVLKPCGAGYFNLDPSSDHGLSKFIKLKKDYIEDMGDEADFAVIGGSYNAQMAVRVGDTKLRWTTFYLGCLMNKEEVVRYNVRPCFKAVGSVSCDQCIPRTILDSMNSIAQPEARPFDTANRNTCYDLINQSGSQIDDYFENPFVFEVLGSGYAKASNTNFLMLRHPRVKKLHRDRTWRDCVSFQELQALAEATRAGPVQSESQETISWIKKLERKCKRKAERERISGSPRTQTSSQSPTKQVCAANQPHHVSDRSSGVVCIPSTVMATPEPRENRASPHCTSSHRHISRRDASDQRILESFEYEHIGKDILKDITHAASNLASLEKSPARSSNTITLSRTILRKRRLSFTSDTPTNDSKRQKSSFQDPLACRKSNPDCVFKNATVFLSPCIASTPYIAKDLLSNHDISLTTELAHWNRETCPHEEQEAIVPESPSYPDQHKIVLVEARRQTPTKEVIRAVLQLSEGKSRERIEVYDWRILEKCISHELSSRERRQHLVGFTMFHEHDARSLFVSDLDWLN